MTTLHRNLGTRHDPVMAGAPLRLECTAASLDLRFGGEIEYALFHLDPRDSIVGPPAFVLSTASGGIVVTVATAGMFSVLLTTSHTAMWSGRESGRGLA